MRLVDCRYSSRAWLILGFFLSILALGRSDAAPIIAGETGFSFWKYRGCHFMLCLMWFVCAERMGWITLLYPRMRWVSSWCRSPFGATLLYPRCTGQGVQQPLMHALPKTRKCASRASVRPGMIPRLLISSQEIKPFMTLVYLITCIWCQPQFSIS